MPNLSHIHPTKQLPSGLQYLTIDMPKLTRSALAATVKRDRTATRQERLGMPLPPRLWMVHITAPHPVKRAVATCAQYFRAELHYQFIGYDPHHDDEGDPRAFLWCSDTEYIGHHQVWGAGCFRWRQWSNCPPMWALQWVWIHPFMRGQGLLSAAWPYFVHRFGSFDVERPHSRAMQGFLQLVGWVRPVANAREGADECNTD